MDQEKRIAERAGLLFGAVLRRANILIAALAIAMISVHLILRFALGTSRTIANIPLWITLIVGGIPLLLELGKKLLQREFGSDLLAGISIVSSVILGEYLAGALVVLMLSGGEAIESFAVRNASSVLRALAKRVPSLAHRKSNGKVSDIPLNEIVVNDNLIVYPHDICPVDGVVVEGHGTMDESFLTGEPFLISKTPGAAVISGAVNGEAALTIRASRLPIDSRYAKIMQVMQSSEQHRPRIRRLGDQLGAWYTPLALIFAAVAWGWSGDPVRFLAVLVIATPCPLLIGIPVAIIGAISLSARRAIIIKNPAALEQTDRCRVVIFDKTGTLTYGMPKLTQQFVAPGFSKSEILQLAASLERYSKHPLSKAILDAAAEARLPLAAVDEISEPPGGGLRGRLLGREVFILSRNKVLSEQLARPEQLPAPCGGLECFVVVDQRYAGAFYFRDAPRSEGASFIRHLIPKHRFHRMLIVSGDRESEVRYLADQVGIQEVHAQKSPEEKLEIVRNETALNKTVYVGDGINDAPAMMAATVGVALGSQNAAITSEAADVVIMEGALRKVDELMHISRRMRHIALQSAIGGMGLSIAGMFLAAGGSLTPVAGAITQEVIDVFALLNAVRAAFPPRQISDFPLPAKDKGA